MELWTHKILNCPPPPDKFIQLALKADLTRLGPQSASNLYAPGKDYIAARKLIADNTNIPLVRIPRFDLDNEFNTWVKKNIFTNFFESAIAISENSTGSLGPHTDRLRDYVLMYVLQSGGKNCCTTFWQEHGQPAIRPRITLVDNYNKLYKIGEINLSERQWILLNSRILHSVDNINGQRIAIQISIDHDISELIKYYID